MFTFTTDTRKDHCPIRIVYCDPGIAGAVHASHIQNDPRWEMTSPIALIKGTEHSDYSGGAVHASNHRVLWRKFPHLLTEIYGSHGYKALAYDAALGPIPESEELSDMLTGLEEYAACDDDDLSALEAELESEAWESHGRQDFRKALVGVLDAIDDDDGAEAGYEHELPDDDSPIGEALCDGGFGHAINSASPHGVTPPTKWGDLLHILWLAGCDVDEWCSKAKRRDADSSPLGDVLRCIAEVCRIAEGE